MTYLKMKTRSEYNIRGHDEKWIKDIHRVLKQE